MTTIKKWQGSLRTNIRKTRLGNRVKVKNKKEIQEKGQEEVRREPSYN